MFSRGSLHSFQLPLLLGGISHPKVLALFTIIVIISSSSIIFIVTIIHYFCDDHDHDHHHHHHHDHDHDDHDLILRLVWIGGDVFQKSLVR